MGYTHYWTPKPLAAEEMNKAATAIKAIIGVSDVEVCGPDGYGKPCLTAENISFNGAGSFDEDYETFFVDDSGAPQFCKTDRQPYDVVVTAVLTYLAAEHGFEVGSDGNASDWEAGGKLATLALGKTFPNPLQEKTS